MLLFRKGFTLKLWSAKQGWVSLSVCLGLKSGLKSLHYWMPGGTYSSPLVQIPAGLFGRTFSLQTSRRLWRETRGLWRDPGIVITPIFQSSTLKEFRASLGYSEIWEDWFGSLEAEVLQKQAVFVFLCVVSWKLSYICMSVCLPHQTPPHGLG